MLTICCVVDPVKSLLSPRLVLGSYVHTYTIAYVLVSMRSINTTNSTIADKPRDAI